MRAGPRRSEGLVCRCQGVSVNRPRESEPENKPGKMRISSFHVYTIKETSVQSERPSFATSISCLACSLIREFSMNCYCRITAYLIRNSGPEAHFTAVLSSLRHFPLLLLLFFLSAISSHYSLEIRCAYKDNLLCTIFSSSVLIL